MNIKGKTVLITGASSGIGKRTAIRFAEEGANVIVNYRVNKKGADEAKAEIDKIGIKCEVIQADISVPGEVEEMFNKVEQEFGGLDILINNGAIPNDQVEFMEADHAEILHLVNTDLVGPMLCSQFAAKIMKKQGFGKILNTSSIRGWEHGGRSVVYAASKAGLNSFTRTFAKSVAPEIQVNAVAPGFVKTRNYDNFPEEMHSKFLDQTVLKRWVTEDEIADAFIFLTKNDAMTGQVIYVDAGFTLK